MRTNPDNLLSPFPYISLYVFYVFSYVDQYFSFIETHKYILVVYTDISYVH